MSACDRCWLKCFDLRHLTMVDPAGDPLLAGMHEPQLQRRSDYALRDIYIDQSIVASCTSPRAWPKTDRQLRTPGCLSLPSPVMIQERFKMTQLVSQQIMVEFMHAREPDVSLFPEAQSPCLIDPHRPTVDRRSPVYQSSVVYYLLTSHSRTL